MSTADAADRLLAAGEAEVLRLQDCWSRFDDSSELSRLNARAGHTVRVSEDLAELVRCAIAGYAITDGLFNPFLARELEAAGYDADIDSINRADPGAADALGAGSRRRDARRRTRTRPPIALDSRRRLVRLDPGAGLDSGGLKGLASDLVSEMLVGAGASGALVNLGGDLRVRGMYPGEGWIIDIDDPYGGSDGILHIKLKEGALCTSTTLKRRWRTADGTVSHHLLDPRLGTSAVAGLAQVSVIAPAAWRAEVWTKAILLAGPVRGARFLRRRPDTIAIVVAADRSVTQLP